MPIGKKLKQVIQDRRISQRDLANDLDVNLTQLNMVLNGKRTISFELLSRFLNRFQDVDGNWLIRPEDTRHFSETPKTAKTELKSQSITDIEKDLKTIIDRLSQL